MEIYHLKNKELMTKEVVPAYRNILDFAENELNDPMFQPSELTDDEIYELLTRKNGEAVAGFDWCSENSLPMPLEQEGETDYDAGNAALRHLCDCARQFIIDKSFASLYEQGLLEALVDKDGEIVYRLTKKGEEQNTKTRGRVKRSKA